MRKRILFVPGKNPKPEPELHQRLLSRCLIEGLRRHSSAVADEILEQDAFSTSHWNYDFYQEYFDFTDYHICVDNLLRQHAPRLTDKVCARTWKIKLSRLIYHTGDRFPWLIDLLADDHVKAMLEGSNQYFDNVEGKAERARACLKQSLSEGGDDCKTLLIGHSLGSVIAYDTLYELSQQDRERKDVDLFLSLGSPLGLRYTQERLVSFSHSDPDKLPSNISEWKNIAARGDLVSVDTTLADDFGAMIENELVGDITDYTKGVYNWFKGPLGYNFHSSYAYLSGPVVSNMIASWWDEN